MLSVAKNNLLVRDLADTKPLKNEKTAIFENKNMKNEANLNNVKFTTTPCNIGCYNVFPPKTQNGTNPIKANFSPPTRRCGYVYKNRKFRTFEKPFYEERTQFQQLIFDRKYLW